MKGFNYRKAIQTLVFFAEKENGTINKMKAYKLIWLSDRWHLRNYGRPILNDTYFALKFGAIPSNTKDLAEGYFLTQEENELRNEYVKCGDFLDKFTYTTEKNTDTTVFSQTDLEALELVYANFGHFSPFELSEISHYYPEWKKFENELILGTYSRFEMNYELFFENPIHENHAIFEQENIILELSKEIFLENKIISNLV